MSRPRRVAASGLLLHVTARSGEGRAAFESEEDRRAFLHLLRKYESRYRLRLHSYALLPDHFHLLLSSDLDGGIPRAMRDILGSYSKYYNRGRNRRGSLWDGRYRSEVLGGASLYQVRLRLCQTGRAVGKC